MLGLMALAAILAIGNMAWWLQRSRGPELAATLAEAPTAPPQTPLTPDLPEPVVLAPDPTVAPMLSASMAPLDKTELPVTRPPTDAPRPKARVPVKPRAVPPKPPPSGEPVLFDFPK
jgi:hypothetical protein